MNRMEGCGSEEGEMVGYSGCGNEPQGSVEYKVFLD